ncbi:SPOR domain-containing protein [Flavobacterium franklandianum]|uniref:SPOR domain-containing protein n=1 Tax=Flavobacterium franklandianum TaxID=2594430 RepID=UPI001179E225|nr:SPOR domain-containing protein [Flavobacterium franklandianum]TRX26630.1 SPOR domain-containing protein [Flavobacterium franklandianum]
MKIIALKKIILSCIFIGISINYSNAQDQNVTVNQDPKFEQLLNEKRKINTSLTVNDSYKIQIFTGSSENAKKTLNEFRQEFTAIDATIIFNTPNYKVWVGSFRTRIEAEKTLADVKDRYKNVLLIKPSR